MIVRKTRLLPILAVTTLCGALALSPAVAASDELDLMQRYVDLMRGYYDIIESGHSISADAEKAAILHMHKIKEVMEERGQAANAAPVFRDVLEQSRNPTIRAAAFLLLSETLKETGRSEDATRVLIEGLKESVENANP